MTRDSAYECDNDNHPSGCQCPGVRVVGVEAVGQVVGGRLGPPQQPDVGRKDDFADGKTERYDLIPIEPMADVARLYGFGANKYGVRNWERGFDWSRAYNALRRHLDAFWSGEDLDDGPGGSGLPHIIAVVWNALALAEFAHTHPELDDRPRSPQAPAPLSTLATLLMPAVEEQP